MRTDDDDDSNDDVSLEHPSPSVIQRASHFMSAEEWNSLMRDHGQVAKHFMNELIMEYLVIGGYKKAALQFERESCVAHGNELNSIDERVLLRSQILSGDIPSAAMHINTHFPEVLENDVGLRLQLYSQQFVELLLCDDVVGALLFAKQHLAPIAAEHKSYTKDIQQIMTLAAFPNLSITCPSDLRHLLSPQRRLQIADMINRAVLSHQHQNPEAQLPHLMRLVVHSQNELKRKASSMSFPLIDDFGV